MLILCIYKNKSTETFHYLSGHQNLKTINLLKRKIIHAIKQHEKTKRKYPNLESVLVTLGHSKVLRDLPKLWNGNLVAFTDPFLKNVGDTSLGQPQPEDSGLQVVTFLRILDRFTHSTWRDRSWDTGSTSIAKDAARTAFSRVT